MSNLKVFPLSIPLCPTTSRFVIVGWLISSGILSLTTTTVIYIFFPQIVTGMRNSFSLFISFPSPNLWCDELVLTYLLMSFLSSSKREKYSLIHACPVTFFVQAHWRVPLAQDLLTDPPMNVRGIVILVSLICLCGQSDTKFFMPSHPWHHITTPSESTGFPLLKCLQDFD